MDQLREQLSVIDAQIAALKARKHDIEAQMALQWPKRIMLYAYCNKEMNYEQGEALGLTGGALRLFSHFEEVRLDVRVAEDGRVTILTCNGYAVVPDARRWTPQMNRGADPASPDPEETQ